MPAACCRRSPLPAVLFPVRSALASTVIYAPIMLALAVAYAPMHRFRPALLAMVPLVALQLLLSLVLGYLLAIFAAAMRDTLQVVAFLLSVGIFLSPGPVSRDHVPAGMALGALAEPHVRAGHRLPGHPAAGAVARLDRLGCHGGLADRS